MQEYLTKEEIRQWRSSLEKITLEEYAARLGKVIQGEKQTNDMIDKVMTTSLHTMSATPNYTVHTEKLETLTLHTMFDNKESKTKKETSVKPAKKVKVEPIQETNKSIKTVKAVKEVTETVQESQQDNKSTTSVENITFKKPLIPREQMIFDYLVQNKGTIVYAKDMAALLELPRDYVYKYIKNLRQKINENVLFNADNGGYVLEI